MYVIESFITLHTTLHGYKFPDNAKTAILRSTKAIFTFQHKCPSVELKTMNEIMASMLDSSNMVSLIWQDYLIIILGCGLDQ